MGTETSEKKIRANLLKVPVDIIPPEQLSELIYDFLREEKEHNIVLLSLWDLLRARRNGEYRSYVIRASLVVPISKSIISGLKFLTGNKAFRYMPFDFVIKTLASLENREYSCYLLGGKTRVLMTAEKHIRQTFPKLRIVGRFPGSFKRHEEAIVIKAINKASPSLLMVGKGIRGGEKWIARKDVHLGKGIRLWCSDIFDVFAEKKKHPSRAAFDKGFEWIGYCFQKPLRFFRIFPYIYYKLLLLVYKLSRRS
ncbi:MAG: WecB/TagA/CpsF family glycosyltransferase [Treponema sp.]|jgi:N-acetylglucosaminyldiphosphoundecaprenol N-acetyl-beta-D-mannosaminyltransferase|nr:WecB/TagA/CpsF family glycosyltransferase [Treponema sp.]